MKKATKLKKEGPVEARREAIKKYLANLKGKTIECPALGKNVDIVAGSIRETAVHAAKSERSTLAVFRIEEAINKAKYVKLHAPKQGKQSSMNFIKVHELKAFLSGIGEVKIIVGERQNKRILHYCITAKK